MKTLLRRARVAKTEDDTDAFVQAVSCMPTAGPDEIADTITSLANEIGVSIGADMERAARATQAAPFELFVGMLDDVAALGGSKILLGSDALNVAPAYCRRSRERASIYYVSRQILGPTELVPGRVLRRMYALIDESVAEPERFDAALTSRFEATMNEHALFRSHALLQLSRLSKRFRTLFDDGSRDVWLVDFAGERHAQPQFLVHGAAWLRHNAPLLRPAEERLFAHTDPTHWPSVRMFGYTWRDSFAAPSGVRKGAPLKGVARPHHWKVVAAPDECLDSACELIIEARKPVFPVLGRPLRELLLQRSEQLWVPASYADILVYLARQWHLVSRLDAVSAAIRS